MNKAELIAALERYDEDATIYLCVSTEDEEIVRGLAAVSIAEEAPGEEKIIWLNAEEEEEKTLPRNEE